MPWTDSPLDTMALALLADAALKGAAVVLVAALAARLLRRRSAAMRHAVWTAAVLAQLAIPALTLALPEWRVPLAWAPAWLASPAPEAAPVIVAPVVQGASAVATATDAREGEAAVASPAPSHAAAPAREPATPARRWHPLLVVWLAGASAVLAGLLAGTLGLWRLARRGQRVHDGGWLSLTQQLAERIGIARPLTLLRGADVAVPVTWGVVYPVVLLPPGAEAWDEEQRRYVLVHEMAHVRRLDALTQLLAQLATAVFWFDPLVWLAARRMRIEREHACDDYVLREGTAASRYADDLLAMVRSLASPAHRRAQPAFAALAMARRSEFEGRMQAILDARPDRHPLRARGATMLVIAVAAVVLPLAAFRPAAHAATTFQQPAAPAAPTAPATPSAPSAPSAPTAPAAPARAAATSIAAGVAGAVSRVTSAFSSRDDDRCDDANPSRRGGSSTTSISSNDHDGEARTFKYYTDVPGRCAEAVLRGEVEFSDDERTVVRMGSGAVATFRERTRAWDRRVAFEPAGGSVRATMTLDGRPVDDAAAREWAATIVQEILRETGVNAPARVARLRAQGGAEAVLAMIDGIRSGSSRRAHYMALLDAPDLDDRDVERTVRHATRGLDGSDGDLRAVLQNVPARAHRSAGVRAAIAAGAVSMESDGDRRAVLVPLVEDGEREIVLAALEGARAMESDGDTRAVLVAAAPSLARDDAALRAAYFAAARGIDSDGDLSAVLVAAMQRSPASPALAGAVLDAVDEIDSDGDAARVLVTMARRGLVTTPELRDRYVAAARRLSDGDERRALNALGSGEGAAERY